VKGKPLDNIEMGQWFKRYYEIKFGKGYAKEYDAVGRRGKVDIELPFEERRATKTNTIEPKKTVVNVKKEEM